MFLVQFIVHNEVLWIPKFITCFPLLVRFPKMVKQSTKHGPTTKIKESLHPRYIIGNNTYLTISQKTKEHGCASRKDPLIRWCFWLVNVFIIIFGWYFLVFWLMCIIHCIWVDICYHTGWYVLACLLIFSCMLDNIHQHVGWHLLTFWQIFGSISDDMC